LKFTNSAGTNQAIIKYLNNVAIKHEINFLHRV
jgi:hypothetical protein